MFNYARFTGLTLAGLLLLASASSALATQTVIFNHDERGTSSTPFPNSTAARNTFLDQVTALGATPFNQNLSSGIPNGANPSFGFPGSTISATTANLTFQFVTFFGVNDTNDGPASSALIETEVATGTGTTAVDNSISFSQPINAFGLYLGQVGDVLGHPLTFRFENTLVPGSARDVTRNVGPNWQSFALVYLGFIDTVPFNKFTLIEDTDVDQNGTSDDLQDGIILDNLTVAVLPTPEPDTMAMLSVGAALVCLARFRRRK